MKFKPNCSTCEHIGGECTTDDCYYKCPTCGKMMNENRFKVLTCRYCGHIDDETLKVHQERMRVAREYATKPAAIIFPKAPSEIAQGTCPTCKEPVGEFKDEISKKEYSISGMCQNCQDGFFR